MNNNENQNMNMNMGGMDPNLSGTPTPMPMDSLQNGTPVSPTETVNPNPTPSDPVLSAPTSFGAPMGTLEQPIGGPVPAPTPQPVEGLQLQPEGTVVPEPLNNPTSNVAQPLMGATLNDQTVLNSTSVPTGTNDMNAFGNVSNTPVNNPLGGGMPAVPPNNMGMMGGVPAPPVIPSGNEKNRKKMSTPLLIVLIVVLIAAVGFGVYYFLFASKKKAPNVVITPILTELELGNDLENDPKFFGKVSGMDISSCKIETNIDYNKVGTYTYSITCGNKQSLDNKVIVKDTLAPDALLKDVIVLPNTTVRVEDFIEEVIDASPCTYEFKSAIDTTQEGEFDVDIVLTDAYGNETTVTGFLLVDSNAPQYYLVCEQEGDSETYETAKILNTYRYGINPNGEYYNSQKVVTYTFESEEDYLTAKEAVIPNEFDGLKGNISYDDEAFKIVVNQKITMDDLSLEFNLTPFPTGEFDIENYHLDHSGSCTIENN